MPRPKKSAHLKLRKERRDAEGRITHKAVYYIYDDGKQHPTGCGPSDLRGAEEALREYLVKKHAEEVDKPGKPKRLPPSETYISDVIAYYSLHIATRFDATESTPEKPDQRKDFIYRMGLLLGYWGDKFVDDIDGTTCGEFGKYVDPETGKTITKASARRCLEDLRAAVNRYKKDRKMAAGGDYVFVLPEKNPARYGFFTRNQVARLVWAAYRKKQEYSFTGKRARSEKRGTTKTTAARPRRHIARFLLVGVYTGTRSDRIQRASFYQEPGRPYVDVDAGIFYRSAVGEMVPDNKMAKPIRIPQRLLGHMRRWKKNGARYVCEYQPGKTGSTASAYFRLLRETMTPAEVESMDLNRHTMRHTCATWAMQAGLPMIDIAGYLSVSEKIIREHYGHHHPDHQGVFGDAFTSGRAGRIRFGREEQKKPPRQTAANNPLLAEEVRGAIRDLLELFDAPVHLFGVVDSTPDAGLVSLRESVKRCARSGDWDSVVAREAAE